MYRAFNGYCKSMLIDKSFTLKKLKNASMDLYFIYIKEVMDLLEKVDIDLLEDVVVYCTMKNLFN